MLDDAEELNRKADYADRLLAMGRWQRTTGFVCSLLGVLIVVWTRYKPAPDWALFAGLALVALGWGLFAYVMARRAWHLRAHPFDPNG